MKIKIKIFFASVLYLFSLVLSASADEGGKYKENELLVEFHKNRINITSKSGTEKISDFANDYGLVFSEKEIFLKKTNYARFILREGNDIEDMLRLIKKDARVKNVQPNYYFQNFVKLPKDRFVSKSWWIFNDGKYGTAGADMSILPFWDYERRSWPNVQVGIIDSGVNRRSSDIKDNLAPGYDFVRMRRKVVDRDGHGSFISSLIAAEAGNHKGVTGMSRWGNLKIAPLRFDFTTVQAIEAIIYAQSQGIRVLNMSWGTDEYDSALYEAIKDFNGLAITSAGNDGKDHSAGNVLYPCDFDLENVVCVGSSDEDDQITTYSDFGTTVDLLAPGGEDSPLIGMSKKKNQYEYGEGTSYSTAFVSGTAALVWAYAPTLTPSQVKQSILENVRKKDEILNKVSSGGILNVNAAVLAGKNKE